MMRCRFCGSSSLHSDTQHKVFSPGKAAAGAVVFGAVGAAAGFIGKEKQGYRCAACGNFMDIPMDTFTGMQIDNAIRAAKKGDTTLYNYFKNQYPNIETVTAPVQTATAAPAERAVTAPTETLGQEETVKRSYRYGLWSPDAPVYVESVVLKTDGKEDRMSLVAWNQSGKEIRSLYLNVVVFDDTGDEVSRCRCVYQNMTKDEDESKRLPVDKTFSLNTDVAYRVQVEQEKAAFEDGSTWRAAETDKVYTLPEQPVLTEENFPRIQYVHSKYAFIKFHPLRGQPKPKIRLNMPMQEADFWMCDCGHPAKKDEPCPYCRNEYWALEKLYSQQTLFAEQQKAVRTRAEERTKKMQPKYEQLVEAKETAEKDAKYWSAQRLMQSHSIPDIQKAKSILAELSGWRDAAEIMTNCDRKIEQIKAQEKKDQEEAERRAAEEAKRQEEERIAKKKATKKRIITLAIVLMIAAACAAFLAILFRVIIPNQRYNAALALKEAGQYEESIAAFEMLDGYKDSSEQIKECETAIREFDYNNALALKDAKDYEKAIEAFEQLGFYRDSSTLRQDCIYEYGMSFYNAGNWLSAITEFQKLNKYKDSADMLNESKYRYALELYNSNQYAEAIAVMKQLVGYKDCNTYLKAYWDKTAVRNTIAAGWMHTVAVKNDGTVIATKIAEKSTKYDYGQCDVSEWRDIIAVASCWEHTVGLRSDGTVVATGNNEDGQCNVSHWTDIVAICASSHATHGLKMDGSIVSVGEQSLSGSNWTAISSKHGAFGLTTDGKVFTKRYGFDAVSDWNDIVAIAAGSSHVAGLKSDGTVVASMVEEALSSERKGQCDVSRWSNIVSIAAGDDFTVGLKADGTVVAVGDSFAGTEQVARWSDIVAIAAGNDHIVGLRSDGTVVAVGRGWEGQLNVSSWTDIKVPSR